MLLGLGLAPTCVDAAKTLDGGSLARAHHQLNAFLFGVRKLLALRRHRGGAELRLVRGGRSSGEITVQEEGPQRFAPAGANSRTVTRRFPKKAHERN